MAPCQAHSRRYLQAPSEAVERRSKYLHNIVAEGWIYSYKCNCGMDMEFEGFAKFAQCQWLHRKEAAEHFEKLRQRITIFHYGEEEFVKRKGIMSTVNKGYRRRKKRWILCLTKNSGSGWTRMMKSLLPALHTWDVLKGIFPQTAVCVKGRDVLASSPGCQAVFLSCQSGRVLQS